MIAAALPNLHDAIPVIISLIIIEGLLSVDNILAIAAMASGLPDKEKKIALRLGLGGAYLFRGVALFFVGFIMANMWLKFLGAFYLIHLMAEHFSSFAAREAGDSATSAKQPRKFWSTVFAIQLMDLSLSVDNVITAVAMSPDIRVVSIGVCLGLLTLWMFATLSLKLVEKYPVLQHTAFLLIGYVGAILLVELSAEYMFHTHLHIGPGQKFIGIAIIMVFSIWYSRSELLRTFGKLPVKVAGAFMMLYSRISGSIIAAILLPFKAVAAKAW
jgi:tellurite resistance protein TerC